MTAGPTDQPIDTIDLRTDQGRDQARQVYELAAAALDSVGSNLGDLEHALAAAGDVDSLGQGDLDTYRHHAAGQVAAIRRALDLHEHQTEQLRVALASAGVRVPDLPRT